MRNIFFGLIIFLVFFTAFFIFRLNLTEKIETPVVTNITEQRKDKPLPFPASTPIHRFSSIVFTGDLMFDRHIREHAKTLGNHGIFEKIAPFLQMQDVVVANLEGPLTTNQSKSVGSAVGSPNNYIFTFDPSLAETLKQQHITIVNLGNNHILNFGQDGLKQTHEYLKKAGIAYFGNTGLEKTSEERTYLYTTPTGVTIGFVNYNQFTSNGKTAVKEDLQYIKDQVDLVVVYTHWGIEYATEPNKEITSLAHEFIDLGADLVIGSHPHVTQTTETYHEKTIVYSLGNFIFDQYFSTEVQNSYLVRFSVDDMQKRFFEPTFFPIQMQKNGQTILVQ